MDLKVIEKSRKLLIQCMGQDKYDQFIEDGKILLYHKDQKDETKEIIYELDQDGRIYNRTTNESYCIEALTPDNLPIHDQLAIRYSYLKNDIKRVEEVANKRSIVNTQYHYNNSIIQETGRERRSSRPDYSTYVEYMESLGWMREQITLDEHNTRIVSINDVKNDSSSPAIMVRSPAGFKISFMGIHQIPAGMDIRCAHAIRIKFANDADHEISDNSGIRITKEKTNESRIQLERLHYSDLNFTKKLSNNNNDNSKNDNFTITNNNSIVFKRDDEWYRFSHGVELNSDDMLKIYVIDSETDIYSRNTKFAIDCDLWHR